MAGTVKIGLRGFLLLGIILSSLSSHAHSRSNAEPPSAGKQRAGISLLLAQGPHKTPADPARLNRFFDASRSRSRLQKPPAPIVRPDSLYGTTRDPRPTVRPLNWNKIKQTRHHPLVVPAPKATFMFRRTFRILRNNPAKTDRYDDLILKYAERHQLDPRLIKAIIAAESEFKHAARSPAGAVGLMQLMPNTGKWMGVPRSKLTDPESNIRAGAKFLAWLFRQAWKKFKLEGIRYKDAPLWVVQRVIASYNAGPRFLTRTWYYRETRNYVRKVLLFYNDKVTDIRRVPVPTRTLPEYKLIRTSSGFYH